MRGITRRPEEMIKSGLFGKETGSILEIGI
jgi:hypothetical protein